MIPRNLFRVAAAFVAASAGLLAPARAQVECWAPGMTAPVTLTEATRYRLFTLTKPYRYDVFGVAGRLELGNRAVNATVVDNRFRQAVLGIIGTGVAVDSTAYVKLQTALLSVYPEYLEVKGPRPGNFVGPVQRYGANWTLSDPRNPVDVNLGFHMAGSSLLTGLVPGLLSAANYNLNPVGHFYVLGECHLAPPVMTGRLTLQSESVLLGAALPITYGINRAPRRPVYRPPFLGLDLGDVNLTVIGTPPAQPTGTAGVFVDLPQVTTPNLLAVTLDLSGNQGSGWLRIRRNP